MIKVMHVIKSLELGGAEMVLRRLIEGSDGDRFSWEVVSLTSVGPIGRDLRLGGIQVYALGAAEPFGFVAAVPRLARLLRARRPDLVQTWMYHGDLVGGLAAQLVGSTPVVWGVHAGSPPLEGASVLQRTGLKANASLSRRLPARIICCSHTTARVHASLGYDKSKMVVVPNGFRIDAAPTTPKSEQEVPIVLRVGRDHPDKDIPTFIGALGVVRRGGTEVKGVLVGPGLHRGNRNLVEEVRKAGLSEHLELLGPRDDIDQLLRTASVAVSSSSGGEGLPLIVGEAMAAATPVVTTDVGDSGLVVDDPARVVAPRNQDALAEGIKRVLELSPIERQKLGERDQEVIAQRWSLAQMIDGYCGEYVRLAGGDRGQVGK